MMMCRCRSGKFANVTTNADRHAMTTSRSTNINHLTPPAERRMPKEQPFLRNIPAVDEYIFFPVISHLVIFLHVIGLELYPCGRSTKSHGGRVLVAPVCM